MSNIGISIGAENRELLSTLSSSEAALRRFAQSSSSSMQGFSQAARQSEDAVTRLYQGMQTAFIGGGIAAGLITLQNGIQGVTQALVEAQTSSDKLTNTLSMALGAENAAQEVAYLKAMTQELGVSYGATTQMYARFAAAAKNTVLEGAGVRAGFESLSKAAVTVGMSMEESEGMFRAVTQMLNKGKISAEELTGQLGEYLPRAFALFAESMRMTTGELSKALELGQVGPERLAEFFKILEKEVGPGFGKAVTSMQSNINRLGNEWLWFKQAVVNSGVGAAMSDALGSATTALGGARAGIEAATDSGAAMRTVFDAAGIAAVALGGSIASRVVTALRDKAAAASADRAAMLASAQASATEAQASATSTAAKLADLRATEASIVATRQQAIEEMKAAAAAAQSAQSLNARQSALVRYTAAQMELNATAGRQQAVHGELSQALAQHQTAMQNASTATNTLVTAQNAASVSGRAMGAVMGALGGPVGIAITAITLLIGKLVSLQSAANDAALAGLSRDRVNQASANGAQAEVEDLAAIRTELQKLKRERDQLTLDQKDPGLLGAIFGGDYASGIVNQLNAVNAKIAENEQVLQRQTASQNGTAGAITNTAAAQSNALQALLRTTEGVRTASSINDDYAKKLSAAQSALKNYLATETDASKASEAQRRFKEYQVELTKGRDAALKSLNKTVSNSAGASRDYARAVDSELASLQAKVQTEAQYAVQLAQHGLAAARLTEGEKEAAKIGYELALAFDAKAQATTKEGRAKIDARIATLQLHQAEAQRLADFQLQNKATKDALELGQKAIDDLQKQADAIRDKTAALAEENAAYGQINPTLAKALAQGKELAGQMVMTDGSVMDYERAQRAAEAWALMNGYIGQLMQQDWNKINGAVQEWQRSATEQAKLYEDEARLSGLSALERAKVVAARQVELKLAKQIAEIERTQFSEDPAQDAAKRAQLIADATTAAQTESSAAVAKVVQEDWTRTSEKIEEVLIDALMDGGKSGAEYIEDLFRTMVLRPVLQAIVSPVAGAVTSALGFSGAAQAGQSGGGLGGLSSLNTAYSAITTGIRSSIASDFEKLVTNGVGEKLGLSYYDGNTYQTTGLGEQFSGVAQGLGSTMTAYGLQKSLSGGYQTGEPGLVDAATAIGGFFDPTGGLIAGAIGGTVNRAFGRKLKDQGLEGTFGGADGFDGNSYEFYKGGWFRSDETKRKALDSGVEDALETQFKALQTQTALMAQTLGLGVDSVADFTSKIKVSFKGLSEEQISERMAEEFGKVAESMASVALGTTEYTRTGETAVETLTRLSSSLTTVNGTFDVLGQKLLDTSLAGADMASQLVDLMGGLESFTATTASYYQNFYTEAEHAETATRQLTQALAAIGVDTLPATREAFRSLVEAQDITTESGRETYAALLGLSGAFAALVPVATELSTLLGGLGTAMVDETIAAIDKQIEASTRAGDAARDAAEKYRDAARSLSDVALEIRYGAADNGAAQAYTDTLAKAQGGDLTAMQGLGQSATVMLEQQRGRTSSAAEYAIIAAQTANQLQQVSAVADVSASGADYQAMLYDVNTAALEVLKDSLQTGNVTQDLLQKQMDAIEDLGTLISDSAQLTIKAYVDESGLTRTGIFDAGGLMVSSVSTATADQLLALATQTTTPAGSNTTLGGTFTNALSGKTTTINSVGQSQVDALGLVQTEQQKTISATDVVAQVTGENVSLSDAILAQLKTPDASAEYLAKTIGLGNDYIAGRLGGIIAAINQQTAEQQAELKRQQDLQKAQAELEAVALQQKQTASEVNAAVKDIWSLASKYGLTLQANPGESGNTAYFKVNDSGTFEADYDQISGNSRNFEARKDAFKNDFYAAGGVRDRTYGRASELSNLAAQLDSYRQTIIDLGGVPAFHTGGYTGPGGKYEAAGVVHRGEVVFSQDDIARLGGVRAVEAIRTGEMPGYAQGGTVGAPVVVPAPLVPGRVAMAPRPAATPATDPVQQEREAQARDQAQRDAQQQTQDLIQQLRQVNSHLTDLKRSVDKSGQANDQMNNKLYNTADTTLKLLRKFDSMGLPVVDVTPVQEAATEEAA